MRKYIPYIVLIIFFVITIIMLLLPTKIKDDKILYYKKNYNLNSSVNNNDYLNVNIMTNNKNSYFVDKTQITHSYLTNQDISSIIDLEIVDIIDDNATVKYEEENYYSYTFVFKVLFKTTSFIEWYIKDSKLMIGFNGNKNYELNIGNFSLIKLEQSNHLITISNVIPLMSKIEQNEYLTGLVLGIRSTKEEIINLQNIKIMNEDIKVGNNISKINSLPNSIDFKEVLGYEYKNQISGDGIMNYKINYEVSYFIIPLYYEELFIVNNFPIEFTLVRNNELHKFYFSGFKYFEINNEIIEKENIYIYDIL